jgi:DNA-binding NtrC family response regulator
MGRELASRGYHVMLAENRKELASMISRDDTLDLLILDEETLRPDTFRILERLGNRVPPLPFILHSYSVEGVQSSLLESAARFVEKSGDIEALKEAVEQVLREEYPHRFDFAEIRPA